MSTFRRLIAFNEDLDLSDDVSSDLWVFIKDGLEDLRFIEMCDELVLRTEQALEAFVILSLD